jgi:hypothetical protein
VREPFTEPLDRALDDVAAFFGGGLSHLSHAMYSTQDAGASSARAVSSSEPVTT